MAIIESWEEELINRYAKYAEGLISRYRNLFQLEKIEINHFERCDWINENSNGLWRLRFINRRPSHWLIYFEFEEDMVQYKLRWL